jgi:hypothetical protein
VKNSGYCGCCTFAVESLRSSRLFASSLLALRVGLRFAAPLLCILVIGCGTATERSRPGTESQRTDSSRAESTTPTVTSALFDPALRAAMAFTPDLESTTRVVPLDTELRLIKPSIKSESDQQVFALLEKVAELHRDLQLLDRLRQIQATSFEKAYTDAAQGVSESEAAIAKSPFAKNNATYASLLAIQKTAATVFKQLRDVVARGGVAVAVDSSVPGASSINAGFQQTGVIEIAQRRNAPLLKDGLVTFVNADELRRFLKAGSQALIDGANNLRSGNK